MPTGVYERKPSMDRFWEKVSRTEGCWLWTAFTNRKGYGQFWNDGKLSLAHRFSYEQFVGPIPDGLQLDHRHTCPKCCVNPAHLRVATQQQNTQNLAGARADSKTGVRGVCWHKGARRWSAQVHHNGKQHYLGLFDTVEEAEVAAIAKRLELFTHNDMDRATS